MIQSAQFVHFSAKPDHLFTDELNHVCVCVCKQGKGKVGCKRRTEWNCKSKGNTAVKYGKRASIAFGPLSTAGLHTERWDGGCACVCVCVKCIRCMIWPTHTHTKTGLGLNVRFRDQDAIKHQADFFDKVVKIRLVYFKLLYWRNCLTSQFNKSEAQE